MKDFVICIPTLNRADLLIPALQNYFKTIHENNLNVDVVIYNNGNPINIKGLCYFLSKTKQYSYFTQHIITSDNNGVAVAWNYMLHNFLFKSPYNNYRDQCDLALILNDDVEVDLLKIHSLIKSRKESKQEIQFGLPDTKYQWSAFLISSYCVGEVGMFDQSFFPAYFEDKDYEYRMKLKGINVETFQELNPTVYRQSQTIKADPSLNDYYQKNQDYFIRKWGALPDSPGKYLTPFNQPNYK